MKENEGEGELFLDKTKDWLICGSTLVFLTTWSTIVRSGEENATLRYWRRRRKKREERRGRDNAAAVAGYHTHQRRRSEIGMKIFFR
jgi:antirestriction protein ArdC